MKKNRFIYSTFAACLSLLGACSSEVESSSNPDYVGAGEAVVVASMQFPNATSGYAVGDDVASGIAKEAEKEIRSIAFFAFTSGATGMYLSGEPTLTANGFTKPLTPASDGIAGNYTASFRIQSSNFSTPTTLVAVANYLENNLTFDASTITIAALEAMLTAAVEADGSIAYPLLMTKSLTETIVEGATISANFEMERIMARVDIINNAYNIDTPADNFELVSARLLSAPAQGSLFAGEVIATPTYVNTGVQSTVTVEGASPSAKQLLDPIYVYEGANADENATLIEVVGRYKGAAYRKEIAFKTAPVILEGALVPAEIVPMDRNTRYVVEISPTPAGESLNFSVKVADWVDGETIDVKPETQKPELDGIDEFVPGAGAAWDLGSTTLNITDATVESVFEFTIHGNQDSDFYFETEYDENTTSLSDRITVSRGDLTGYATTEPGRLSRTYKVTVPATTDQYPSETTLTFYNASDDQLTTSITVKYAPFFITDLKSSAVAAVIDQATKLVDFTGVASGSTPTVSFFASSNSDVTAIANNEGMTSDFYAISIDANNIELIKKYGPGKLVTLSSKALNDQMERAVITVSDAVSNESKFYVKSVKKPSLDSRSFSALNASNALVEGNKVYLSVNNSDHGSIVYTVYDHSNRVTSVTPSASYVTAITSPSWATKGITHEVVDVETDANYAMAKRTVTVTLPQSISNPAEVSSFTVGFVGDAGVNLIPVYPSGSTLVAGDKLLKPVLVEGLWWSPVNIGQAVISRVGATSASAGYLFQWGRKQALTWSSATQPGPVSSAAAAGRNFITSSSDPHNWLSPQNDKLWNSGTELSPVKTENDPCPKGWRVPSKTEFATIVGLHTWTSGAGANSCGLLTVSGDAGAKLLFSAAGLRYYDGSARYQGTSGYYWSSSVSGTSGAFVAFNSASLGADTSSRGYGFPVRCLQE